MAIRNPEIVSDYLVRRADELFSEQSQSIFRRADRMFMTLFVLQWFIGIIFALLLSPLTWAGTAYSVHMHVWTAVFLGGTVSAFPIALACFAPGKVFTRHMIALAQGLSSALLIHLDGGRIEAHFHVFGSLAFLAFYRDPKVLFTYSAVVLIDHLVRGIYWPMSVYGVLSATPWRALEHGAWVAFEDFFLFFSIKRSLDDMRQVAYRQAGLERENTQRREAEVRLQEINGQLEDRVRERTEELSRTNEQFHQLADNIPAIFWMSVPDMSDMIYVNPAYESVWGRSVEALYQNPGERMDAVIAEDRTRVCQAFKSLNEGVPFVELDYKIARPDGTLRWIHDRGFQVKDDQGRVIRTAGIAYDITERKSLEQKLVHAQKLEAIGQLSAGIAHEINTPTQYISDNAHFLQSSFAAYQRIFARYRELVANLGEKGVMPRELLDQLEAEEKKGRLEYLSHEIPSAIIESLEGLERVTTIVRSMKDFSHPGSEDKISANLNQCVESTVVVCRNEWKYVADLKLDLSGDLPFIPCFPNELNQVILNLLINASHAIEEKIGQSPEEKGAITIQTLCEGPWAVIRISDTGTGIPEKNQSKVFNPFFTTKEVGRGTGQGLTFAYSIIVEKHGGELVFETHEGKGTTFIIRLPMRQDEPQAVESQGAIHA